MRNVFLVVLALAVFFVLGVSCQQEETESSQFDNLVQQPVNPNGDSELALLMRAMVEEAERIKAQIAAGEPVTITLDHEKILTAHATEPEKAASAEFKTFAATYLQAIEALKAATPVESAVIYDEMISSCMGCHQMLCPGPMMRIKKLW